MLASSPMRTAKMTPLARYKKHGFRTSPGKYTSKASKWKYLRTIVVAFCPRCTCVAAAVTASAVNKIQEPNNFI